MKTRSPLNTLVPIGFRTTVVEPRFVPDESTTLPTEYIWPPTKGQLADTGTEIWKPELL